MNQTPQEQAQSTGASASIVSLKEDKKPVFKTDRKCSWCEKVCAHKRVTKHHGAKRSKYQCENCLKATVRCRNLACDNMSRAHRGWHEGFCIDHNPLFYKEVSIEANCSWCFEKHTHTIQNDSLLNNISLQGKVFACDACHMPTQHCKTCDESMARLNEKKSDPNCYRCSGLISTWDDPKACKEKLTVNAWCPWCVKKSDHTVKTHYKSKTNDIDKDMFQCTECSMDTKRCSQCSSSMALGFLKIKSRCTACDSSLGDKYWENIKAKFDEQCDNYSLEKATSKMNENSEYREKALNAGLLRPFVLLVSMHPQMRSATAFKLEIPLLTEKVLGNPHAEADLILFHSKKGLQRRTNSILESFHIATKCNWYTILRRSIHDLASTESTFKSQRAKKTFDECADPSSEVLNALEMELLDHMAQRHLLMLPLEIRKKAIEMYDNDQVYHLFDDLHSKCQSTDSICLMFIAIVISSGQKDGKLNMDIDKIHLDTFISYLRSYLDGQSALGDKVHDAQFAGTQVAFFIARVIVVGTLVQLASVFIFPPLMPFISAGLFTIGVTLFIATFMCRPTRTVGCQATLLIVFQHFLLVTSQVNLSEEF